MVFHLHGVIVNDATLVWNIYGILPAFATGKSIEKGKKKAWVVSRIVWLLRQSEI